RGAHGRQHGARWEDCGRVPDRTDRGLTTMTLYRRNLNIGKSFYFLAFIIALIPVSGNTMSSLNPFKACTFSEMKLRLTLDGKPADGAKVTRTVNWKEEVVDTFKADENGTVQLPAMYESSVTQVLPVEFVSSQVISVQYQEKDYKIWVYAKRDPAENFEMSGSPLELDCELSDDPKTERAFDSIVKTSCQWN
ncbi:DUF6795 domain-containing protein, partial [Microbulbifer halophilus]